MQRVTNLPPPKHTIKRPNGQVPLPSGEARLRILRALLSDRLDPEAERRLPEVAGPRTEAYSGSDIYLLAKEAAMRPLRRLMGELEKEKVTAAAVPVRTSSSTANIRQFGRRFSLTLRCLWLFFLLFFASFPVLSLECDVCYVTKFGYE